jgi:hypothetical protein
MKEQENIDRVRSFLLLSLGVQTLGYKGAGGRYEREIVPNYLKRKGGSYE